ncbi:hypothetical protein [Streptomyces yangpuensis]|uniref:hypothetical protein n=2 Tax=Streptomyces yangpuensis TaxID=1648182 RepID=UPI0036601E6E
MTSRPCMEVHRPWQTWLIDTQAHRVHPAAYPDKCLEAVRDGRFLYLQTLPCDAANANQDFRLENYLFSREPHLVFGHTIAGFEGERHVDGHTKESKSPDASITLGRGDGMPTDRWNTADFLTRSHGGAGRPRRHDAGRPRATPTPG